MTPLVTRHLLTFARGGEPLTGEDIAEIIVFAASRRENVVVADTLVFPSNQVRSVESRKLFSY